MAEAELPKPKKKLAQRKSLTQLIDKVDELHVEGHTLDEPESSAKPEETQCEENVDSSLSEEPIYESVYDDVVVKRPEVVLEVDEKEDARETTQDEEQIIHEDISSGTKSEDDYYSIEEHQVENVVESHKEAEDHIYCNLVDKPGEDQVSQNQSLEMGDNVPDTEEEHYSTLWPSDPIPEAQPTEDSNATQVPSIQSALPCAPKIESIPSEPKPLSTSQLKSLYYNMYVEKLDQTVQQFIHESKSGNSQFYDLLQSYLRALLKQRQSEECLDLLRKDSQRLIGQVWRKELVTAEVKARCADNQIVVIRYQSEISQLNENVHSELEETLKAIQSLISDEHSTQGYSSQLAWFEIELFIFRLYMEAPILRDMPKNLPPRVLLKTLAPPDRMQIDRLKQCLSSLFSFHRKPITDEQFLTDLRRWTVKLGGSLIRIGDSESHQFILNHLLRCPSGIHKWATSLVQPVLPMLEDNRLSFQDEIFDHTVAMIALLLRPIQEREEFVRPMKTLLVPMTEGLSKQNRAKDPNWILVDSDGETDEDGIDGWHRLHENDLVALLAQMPIDTLFRYVLSITTDPRNGDDLYHPGSDAACTPVSLLRVMAFIDQLLTIFECGLKSYSVGRYKQLNKRLGRLVKHTIQFVTDHWESVSLVMKAVGQSSELPMLQVQYESIFIKAVEILLTSNKLGSWQYLADFPYRWLSSRMKRKILKIFTNGSDMASLEEHIPNLPTAECIYLMTTLSNLGRDCDLSIPEEKDLVDEIVDGIFRLSFVCDHTRTLCVKVGRELLTGMALKHCYIIASVIEHTKLFLRDIEQIHEKGTDQVGIYLFKELPFHLYAPSSNQITLLQLWLVSHRIESVESHLARAVLNGMNWSGNAQGVSLDIDLHHSVALMLVEAFSSHTTSKTWTTVVGDSARHLSSLLYITAPPQETTFFSWCVHLITRLRVHRASWQDFRCDQNSGTIDIRVGGRWQPILNGIKASNPLALYLATAMMPYCDNDPSHVNPGGFLDTSIDYLLTLSKQSYFRLVIEGVRHVVMLSFCHMDFLINSSKFQQIIVSLLRADQSYFQTFKQLLSDDFPGVLLSAVVIMMLDLCENVPPSSGYDGPTMLSFWLRVVTQIPGFQTDRQTMYALEKLLEFSFMKYIASVTDHSQATDPAETIMNDVYQQYADSCIQAAKKRRGLSALINMGAAFVPLYVETMARQYPYLSYYLLKGHTKMEDRLGLWEKLQQKTSDYKMRGRMKQPVEILPDIIKAIDFPLSYLPASLSIYLWGNLMGQVASAHRLHPLLNSICQQFFLRFFNRSPCWKGSMGLHFFESRAMTTQLKSWRGAVRGAQSSMSEQYLESTSSTSTVPPAEGLMIRANICEAMSLWLDEPRLHDPSLQLAALPPQYDADRLSQIFSGYKTPWLDAIRVSDFVDEGFQSRLQRWRRRHASDWSLEALGRLSLQERQKPDERIISRLKRQLRYVPPPPTQPLQPPVQSVAIDVLIDSRLLLQNVSEPLTHLMSNAHCFVEKYDRIVALDVEYHEGLTHLMKNRKIEKTVEGSCPRRLGNVKGCTGPAVVKVPCQESYHDETLGNRLDANRTEYHQLVLEGSIPPSQHLMLAALYVDNAIDSIISLAQSQSEAIHTRTSAISSGVTLFYHLASLVSFNSKTFPPTRHFLAATLEKLGNEFIRGNPAQVAPLLNELLKAPHLVELLSPYFSPLANSALFVSIYGKLVEVPSDQQSEVIFSLLTKFEVREWLPVSPSVNERNQLINHICSGMRNYGSKPTQKNTLVFEVYKSNLAAVLDFSITSHLDHAMRVCLRLAAEDLLCPSVWDNFVVALKNKIQTSRELPMSIEQLQNLLDEQNRFFASHRQKCVRWGLFSHWGKHSDSIIEILVLLVDSLALKLSRSAANQQLEPQQALDIIWCVTSAVFVPWLAPQMMGNNVTVAWLPEETDMANVVMRHFCNFLVAINDKLLGILKQWTPSLIVTRLWFFYSKELMKPAEIPQHLIDVYVTSFINVKLWNNWIIDTSVLQDMNETVRSRANCLMTRKFVITILSRACWDQMQQPGMPLMEQHEFSNFLFNLVVCTLGGKESSTLLKSDAAVSLLDNLCKIQWLKLSATTYDAAIRWFVSQSGSIRFVISDSGSPEGKLLKLVTLAAGVGVPGTSSFMMELWQQPVGSPAQATIFNQLNKQILCLRARIQLFQQLASASHSSEFVPERYATSLVNFLTEAEGTLADIPNAEARMNHGILVAEECLHLLRNCTPSKLRNTLSIFKEWFASSGSSPLLLPLFRCAASNPPSLHCTAVLAEEAIKAFINAPHNDGKMHAWEVLASCLAIPEPSVGDFLREAVSSSSLLCLFLYHVQQQRQHGPNPTRDILMTQAARILEWMSHFNLKPEDELKCILLWDRLLDCLIKLSTNASSDNNQTVRFLNNWTPHLAAWAEDKTPSGMFGIIGFGKRSPLSIEYRFMCRAITAYILAQLPANHSLRTGPNAAGHLTPEMVISSRPIGVVLPTNQALTAVRSLRQLKSNKAYSRLVPWVTSTLEFIGKPENSFENSRQLLSDLINEIFKGEKLLAIIQT